MNLGCVCWKVLELLTLLTLEATTSRLLPLSAALPLYFVHPPWGVWTQSHSLKKGQGQGSHACGH